MFKFYVKFWLLVFILFFSIGLLFSDPPDPITDLIVVETHFQQVKLRWTVPNSTESIKYYEIRISSYLIISNEDDWNNNSSETSYPYRIIITTSPLKGETTTYTITGLINGITYSFAIKSSTSSNGIFLSEIDNTSPRPSTTTFNTTPALFSPIWPTNGIIVSSYDYINFSWYCPDVDVEYGDIIHYTLYYSTSSDVLFGSTPPTLSGAQIGSQGSTTNYLQIPVSHFIDNTTYYWRIFAIDSEGASVWSIQNSNICKFVTNHTLEPPSTFQLLSPVYASTITIETGVFFDWLEPFDPDPQDEISYWLYISSQSENTGFSLIVGGVSYSSYTVTSIFDGWAENTTYWWYVVAKDTFSLETYSDTWYFIINDTNDLPRQNFLLSPGTTIYYMIQFISTLNPTFYWTQSYDPDPYSKVYYQLFISSYSELPEEINSVYFTTTDKLKYNTYYHLSDFTLEDDTTYFWRIKIFDEVYGEHSYSTTTYWFYTCAYLNSAELKSPLDSSTTSYFYPRFEWELKNSSYKLNFSSQTLIYWTDNDTTTIKGLSSYTTFYIPLEKLKNNTTYYWQIITHSNSQEIPLVSTASAIFKFFIHNSSPTSFDLSFPSGTIITSAYTILQWYDSTEPDNEELTYTVFYSTNNFLTYFSSSGIKITSYNLENLQDNTTYYWYVVAVDTWGQSSFANLIFNFVVNHTPENPTGFNLLLPSQNQLLTNTYTTFYWENSFDPDPFESVIYQLKISTDINFSYITFSTKTTETQFFLPKGYLETNSTYYWIVIASSVGSGFTICNSTFSFKIINTPPLGLNLISPQNYTILKSSPISLQWNPAYDPQGDEFWYELYYTTFVNNGVWLSTTTLILSSTEYLYTLQNPLDDTTYYYYIVAVDTYNNRNSIGPFIFWTSFLNQPPTEPTILQPQQNEVVYLPYTIKWTTSTDFDLFDKVKYTIQISTDSNFNFFTIIASSVQETEINLINFSLQPNTYYLRIIAFDENGGLNISTNTFVINRYYISILFPQDNEIIQKLPLEFYFSDVSAKYSGDKVEYKIIYSSYTNFSYKIETNLQNSYYSITQPPLYPNTYYWYIEVYYNNFYAGGSPIFSFIVPNTNPPSPQNVSLSTENYTLRIIWDSVNIDNLWGYKIYSGYDLNNLSQIGFTTSTYYIDTEGLSKNLFYMVSCVNKFGIESVNNTYLKISFGEQVDFYISQDRNLIFSISFKENLSNVEIKRLVEEENENYIYVYDIKANKTKLNNFAEISIVKPQGIEDYVVQYYDGHNWINFQSREVEGKILIKTQYLGKYRVVSLTTKVEDGLTIIGCSPKKRIITPNNDGINDYIEFHYKIDSFIEGSVYNLYGNKICSLKRKDTNILYFDGRNENNRLLPAGIYIYYINSKLDGKNFKGTVIIKY